MFPTLVRQPASGKQRETEWPSQSTTSFGWTAQQRQAQLVAGLCLKWQVRLHVQGTTCTHCIPTSPWAHSPKRHSPHSKRDVEIGCTNLIWCFFWFLPSPDQPLMLRLACTSVQSGRLVVSRMDIAPEAQWQGNGITSFMLSHHWSAVLSSLGGGGTGPRVVGTSPCDHATTLSTQTPFFGRNQPLPKGSAAVAAKRL